MMKVLTVFVTTAVVAGAIAAAANAQTQDKTLIKKKAPPIPGLDRNSSRSQGTTRKLPPPPAVPLFTSRYQDRRSPTSASRKGQRPQPKNEIGVDPTGRVDRVGRPVPFYPAIRSLEAAKRQQSATKEMRRHPPRPNPQHEGPK